MGMFASNIFQLTVGPPLPAPVKNEMKFNFTGKYQVATMLNLKDEIIEVLTSTNLPI